MIFVTSFCSHTACIQNVSNFSHTITASRIQIKSFSDIINPVLIDINSFIEFIIQISKRCNSRESTLFKFRPITTFYIHAQIIRIFFTHAKIHDKHEFIRRVVHDDFINRPNFLDVSTFQKFGNSCAVGNVSSEAVNFPRKHNAILLLFNIFKHFIENWTTCFFCRHTFTICFINRKSEPFGHA